MLGKKLKKSLKFIIFRNILINFYSSLIWLPTFKRCIFECIPNLGISPIKIDFLVVLRVV